MSTKARGRPMLGSTATSGQIPEPKSSRVIPVAVPMMIAKKHTIDTSAIPSDMNARMRSMRPGCGCEESGDVLIRLSLVGAGAH